MQVILWFVDDCRMFAPFPSGGGVAHIIPEGDFFFGAIQGTREVEQVWENCVIIFPHFPLNLVMYFSSLCLHLCWNGTSPRFGSAKMVGSRFHPLTVL